MRTTKSTIDKMLRTSSVVESKGLSREDLESLLSDYHEAAFSSLLDNGYVRISEDLSISLVKLKDRQYVLRGNSYSNHRKYKLKIITSRSIYNKIEDAYSLILEV